jgi:hypothetical protein
MRWIKDTTGRFPKRPYYEAGELNSECERIVTEFLLEKHGKVIYPISTDDLTIMLEREVDDLDLYADFPGDEDVEGVAEFVPNQLASVKIARRISEPANMGNRLRTTLTHEFTHVKFHGVLFGSLGSPTLFVSRQHEKAICKRETIIDARKQDWMEWQAGYGCGALLMPIGPLETHIKIFLSHNNILRTPIEADSFEGLALISEVMAMFEVSHQAAAIRLMQCGALTNQKVPQMAFSI